MLVRDSVALLMGSRWDTKWFYPFTSVMDVLRKIFRCHSFWRQHRSAKCCACRDQWKMKVEDEKIRRLSRVVSDFNVFKGCNRNPYLQSLHSFPPLQHLKISSLRRLRNCWTQKSAEISYLNRRSILVNITNFYLKNSINIFYSRMTRHIFPMQLTRKRWISSHWGIRAALPCIQQARNARGRGAFFGPQNEGRLERRSWTQK